jgi:rfaE bifunctional protein nucleotidyltransferase chain/domain
MFESIHAKVVDRENFKKIREQNLDKKIVLCSGCYDILHSGHAVFFNDCKRYGDILVVSVGTDKVIKSYKGPDRPINNEQNRVHLVAALEDVDYAVLGDDTIDIDNIDFYTAGKEIKPDVLVINSDSGGIDGKKKFCEENGIELIILEREVPEYLEATSTTKILEGQTP